MLYPEFIEQLERQLKNEYSPSEKKHLLDRLARLYTAESLHHWTYIREKQKVADALVKKMEQALLELNADRPIQQIEGEVPVGKLSIDVQNVLIPRPETLELVEYCISDVQSAQRRPERILDICTGSAIIALLLKQSFPSSEVYAWDRYEEVLATAKKNIEQNQMNIHLEKVDVLRALPDDKKYDLIVSNPPYITSQEKPEMEARVLRYEPHEALFVDGDPLLFYHKILAFAKTNLSPSGGIYLECNPLNIDDLARYAREQGWKCQIQKDASECPRFMKLLRTAEV